jgi:hypothetical protein
MNSAKAKAKPRINAFVCVSKFWTALAAYNKGFVITCENYQNNCRVLEKAE